MGTIRVKARCLKCTYRNGDYTIFSWSLIEPNENIKLSLYGTFSTKGQNGYISENKDYELEIEVLSIHPQYGSTCNIISCPSLDQLDFKNLTREESFEILMECTSSERIANNILNAYENFIELVLTEGKEAIDVDKVKGMGDVYLNAYTRELVNKYKYYHTIKRFKEFNIDISDCKELFFCYDTEDKIGDAFSKNPYKVLTNQLKRSFFSVDKLLLEIRPDLKVSEERCASLILYVINKNEEEGDTKLNANDLYFYITENYNMSELEPLIVPTAKHNELFYYNDKEKTIASSSTYAGECLIADFIKDKISNSTRLDIDYTKYTEIRDGTLTGEQSNILKTQCESNIAIINAKGGTGKSSVLMASIQMCEDNNLSYILLSPTGRVAQRIKELTNREAYTIHRACYTMDIDFDVIFVEEWSMVGVELFCMLINSITNPNARIYFNGDIGQIAPIACGCPMRDMLNSNIVPTCTLTKVFRYGEGGLYKMATDAYNKEFYINSLDYECQDRVSIGTKSDYTYVKYNGKLEQVMQEYNTFLNRKIKPKDITIITPWNVTEFGSININNEIQKIVNPDIKENEFVKIKYRRDKYEYDIMFKIGDLILNTKNCYNALSLEGYEMMKENSLLTEEDVKTVPVMNGEIGVIRNIEKGNIISQFGEELIVFNKIMQYNLLLGYCLTSYKLQGSEAPYIITLITPQFSKSLNKNIIYTDMSRARKEVVEIIDPVVLADKIGLDVTEERLTNLKELLINE